jgi:hypothetical protein
MLVEIRQLSAASTARAATPRCCTLQTLAFTATPAVRGLILQWSDRTYAAESDLEKAT